MNEMKLNLQQSSNPPMQHLGLPGLRSGASPANERRNSSIMLSPTSNKSFHLSNSNPNITGLVNDYTFNNNNNLNVNKNNNMNINGSKKSVSSKLSVNPALSIQRRSVIGRLDKRSSFQTQRLSDVGVAVGQQITAKMGLKLPASQERIVEQTRWLYLRYIFEKLRQKSLPLRDLNLTKSLQARRAAALGKQYGRMGQTTPDSANSNNSDHFDQICGKVSPQILRRDRSARVYQHMDSDEFLKYSYNLRSNNNLSAYSINNPDDGGMFNNHEDTTDPDNSSWTSPQTNTSNTQQLTGGRKFIMDSTINKQILSVIMSINKELHDTQPGLYDDSIYELIGIDKFTSINDLLEVQKKICQEMTRTEISWCRIVALFSLFGAMSLDCVRLGSPEHVGPILDGFLGFVERDLAYWISQQGGWEAFLYKYRVNVSYISILSRILILSSPILIWFAISMLK